MEDYIQDFKTYLQERKSVSANTLDSYLRDISGFIVYMNANGKKNISKCSGKDLQGYVGYLNEQGLSSATLMRNASSLRAYFSFLMSENIISLNPASNIKTEKKKKFAPRILTGEEVDLLLNQPKNTSPKGIRDKAMLELLYATGIRVSELINLNTCDININLGFIRCGEGFGERIIPLYQAAIKAIEKYMQSSRALLLHGKDEDALFVNLKGERMSRQGFWKLIKQYQQESGIETELTPNTLRHSFAVHLLENGADIADVKKLMGHADVSSTKAYANHIKKDLKHTYARVHPKAK